jgi:hypothetical protein
MAVTIRRELVLTLSPDIWVKPSNKRGIIIKKPTFQYFVLPFTKNKKKVARANAK